MSEKRSTPEIPGHPDTWGRRFELVIAENEIMATDLDSQCLESHPFYARFSASRDENVAC